jgi:hypothetical protein
MSNQRTYTLLVLAPSILIKSKPTPISNFDT